MEDRSMLQYVGKYLEFGAKNVLFWTYGTGVCTKKLILFLNQNICCWYSKEPSQ